jgi:hypothetical protein
MGHTFLPQRRVNRGVAKKANIFMTKVVGDDASPATSDIISGINVAIGQP